MRRWGYGWSPGRDASEPCGHVETAFPVGNTAKSKQRARWMTGAILLPNVEPPSADPHARWCGRGSGATRTPIPIVCYPDIIFRRLSRLSYET